MRWHRHRLLTSNLVSVLLVAMQTKSSLFELSKYETVCLRCARRYRLVDNLGT